ncbi:5011_t:CDS:1, partial [Scutellospora calospora]
NTEIQSSLDVEQEFLYNLNQFFINLFNTQGVTDNGKISTIYCLKKYIDDVNKNPDEILNQYNTYKHRYLFTGIIGYFYEYRIGTTVDYHKAFDIYSQAAKDF